MGDASTMRAVQYYGKEDIRIEQIPRPPIKPGYVRIAPAFCGICGTDLHEYVSGPGFAPAPGTSHPLTNESLPVGFGHEFSGVILELGEGVAPENYPIDAKCTVQPSITCGECGACGTGASNACPRGGFIGLSGGGGGMADEVLVPAHQVFPVPDSIPLDVAALVEPLAVGWHAVDASGLRDVGPSEAAVLVQGGGPIGLAITQCLRAVGTRTIIVAEVAKQRQEFARTMGAHHVLDPRHVDVVAECRRLCVEGKGGMDVVFDCAGHPTTIRTACNAIRSRGTVVNVAIWSQDTPFNPTVLVKNEGRFIGVLAYQDKDYRAIITRLADGSIDGKSMITARIAMDQLVDKGFKALLTEKDKHVKILIDMKA